LPREVKLTDRRIVRWPTLRELLGGRSRSQIDRDERAGKFPLRVQVGEHAVGWFLDEVLAYLESRERGPVSPPKAAIRANPHHRRKRANHTKAEPRRSAK
jgi:predicted DNA-binding transcriptional regulator AlpA